MFMLTIPSKEYKQCGPDNAVHTQLRRGGVRRRDKDEVYSPGRRDALQGDIHVSGKFALMVMCAHVHAHNERVCTCTHTGAGVQHTQAVAITGSCKFPTHVAFVC